MSAVDLLQPILDGGLQRNNFFNGRLLSAEDLRAEQAATSLQVGLLAQAEGDGVAYGLGVSILATSPPLVRVASGLALNRLGNLLRLAEDADVALVPATSVPDAASGLFVQCEPSTQGGLTADGAYVLAVAPASGYRDTALVSDPNITSAGRGACGARFTVSGVRLRLVPIAIAELGEIDATVRAQVTGLLPPGNDAARERLRNLLAHLCFGTRALGFANPALLTAVPPVRASWGLLDAMRTRGDLTPCDVSLAVVVFKSDGISFVDAWSARRRLLDAAAIDAWRGVAGLRRPAEAEAAFLQFQSQLDVVRTLATSSTIAATTFFDVLPAGGWLPTGSNGFNWRTFLGSHAPPAVTPVDAALLRGILERSWFGEPFALATTPPVPVRVYEVPEQATGASFVVFARPDINGGLRVIFSPAPPTNAVIEVTATAVTGAVARATTRSGATVPIPELEPGPHSVAVTSADYMAVAPQPATVIGGRTVDLSVTLTPLPNGWILVDPIDKSSNDRLMSKVQSISATGGGVTRSGQYQSSSGKWLIPDLPAATYTITGSAPGFQNATKPNVGPTSRNHETETPLLFDRVEHTREEPDRCVNVDGIRSLDLRGVKICIVADRAEFDELYYFGEMPKYRQQKSTGSGCLRAQTRSNTSQTQSAQRFVTKSGERVFSGDPPWAQMIEPDLVSGDDRARVEGWLRHWQHWLVKELEDDRIAETRPLLLIAPKLQTPRNALEVPLTPPGYAVFNRVGLPVSIAPFEVRTLGHVAIGRKFVPGIDEEVILRLREADIVQINQLASAWSELIVDATGMSNEMASYLIADAAEAVPKINAERAYLDVDTETHDALVDLGILDDIALANADEDKLAEKLGSRGFAKRLIEKGRSIVDPSAWSLAGLNLSDGQVERLRERGVDSKGALVSLAGRAAGKTTIADALGLDSAPDAVRDTAIDGLTTEAVTVMTRASVARAAAPSVRMWRSVDALTAAQIADAGIETVDELGAADPVALAVKTGLDAGAVKRLVKTAKAESRASLRAGALATLSRSEEKKLKDLLGADGATVGVLAKKNAVEIAPAFGGNLARADAVLRGITAGLAHRGIR
jgi:hypothetical protein